jgi:Toprim-like
MGIGYAPGACLRGWLTQLGYSLPTLRQARLITHAGYDTYVRRIVFPREDNLYGRSLSPAAPPHRFLPGAKGGLYLWEQVQRYPEVILVEGLFDYAALWQAGFRNVTCWLGTHLNQRQFRQLCDARRTVYLSFDADHNGSGQQAARCLSRRLGEQGVAARQLLLPEGHDPNSFFVTGGNAHDFRHNPPLATITRVTRVMCLRRLLEELAWNQQLPALAHLRGRDDIPRREHYLPRPLTPEQDHLIQQELRRRDDLLSNALLLLRQTGIRIGECVDLSLDCLRPIGTNQWALSY